MLKFPSLRSAARYPVSVLLYRADRRRPGPGNLGHGKTKDYPLWFWAGQQVLHGGNLYPGIPPAYFEFIYPPLSAVLLAIPS